MSEKNPEQEKGKKKKHRVRKIIRNIILVLIGLIMLVIIGVAVFYLWYKESYQESQTEEVTQEEIDEIVTRDEAGGAEIDALPDGDPSDTWAIYAYIDGSNLESGGADSLSELAQYLVDLESTKLEEELNDMRNGQIEDLLNEVWAQGSDLPESLYTVQANGTEPKESGDSDEEEEAAGTSGAGSATIEKLTAADLPENVTVVMMTGGTGYWENPAVNPNRSQIFVYDTEGFREVESDHIKDMGSGSTMAEFLAYCDENYPADHCILSIMDHGSGIGGFAADDLYEDTISYAEFREALESVYTADPDDPPFDIIDFDACLMGSVEMAENLYGFTTYMVATEEVGIGETHDYETYLEALAENTGIHPAKLGKLIVDGTIDDIAEQDYRLSFYTTYYGATMSLTDVTKAHEVYLAYEDLCAAVLQDAVKDISALTTMSRAAAQNLRFGANSYNVFNAVDLGILASNLQDAYPEEAGALLDKLSEASLYRTATEYNKDATGLSVYFPTEINDMYGLRYFLIYINEVCESEDIAALCYYTFTGCLNEEYTDYVESKGYGTPETLDTSPLQQLTYNEVTAGDGANFSLTLTEEQQDLIQNMSLYLVRQEEDGTLNLGEDKRLSVDDNGTVTSDFDGTWISIDGEMLEADVIDVTEDTVRYTAEIREDFVVDEHLVFVQDRRTGAFSAQGVYTETQESVDGAVVVNYPSALDFDTDFSPVYTVVNLDENTVTSVKGDVVEYTEDTELGYSVLDDGDYYLMIKAYDVRGDEYYSAPMHFVMKDGEITEASVSQDSYAVSRE